jgi:hypothetical protein
LTVDVDDGTSRTPAACCRICLVVGGIEVPVETLVVGGVAIEAADEARKNAEGLAPVIANYFYFDTNYAREICQLLLALLRCSV